MVDDELDIETLIADDYSDMFVTRQVFLDKARRASQISIPTYYPLPVTGRNQHVVLEQANQSFVAQGLQNLVSKSLFALLSLEDQTAFFKFEPNPKALQKVLAETGWSRAKLDISLSAMERALSKLMLKDKLGYWVSQALFHIFIGGNYLLYVPTDPKLGIRGFGLDRFCVKRDSEGNVYKIITEEVVDDDFIDEYIGIDYEKKKDHKEGEVKLYSKCIYDNGLWHFSQEIEGIKIDETVGTFKECPYIPLTFTRMNDNDYGTGLVEMYIGDVKTVDILTKLIREASIESAKIIYQVSRSAGITPQKWARVNNGDMVTVNELDKEIKPLETNKGADLQVAYQMLTSLKQSLSKVFLQYEQRDAERVTAEEIRMTIQELEQSLGSFYSQMSVDLQLPLITKFIERAKRSDLPELKTLEKYDLINNPLIVTGLKALGRVNELQKLTTFAQVLAQSFGPNALAMINQTDFANRLASSLSIGDYQNLVKSAEQMQQEQQQAQQQALMQQATPNVVNQVGQMLQNKQNAALSSEQQQ